MADLKTIVFIGGNRFAEDGPLIPFLEICRARKWDCWLITDAEHLQYPCGNGNSFEDELKCKNIKFICVDKICDPRAVELMTGADYTISVSCPWILKKDIIDLVRGKIFNFHGSSLPEQKGAGCHSWRLMQGNRDFHLTFHHLSEEIDGGKVIFEQKMKSPTDCKGLKETYKFIANHEEKAFCDFLRKLELDLSNADVIETHRKEFYWPRLNTDVNGYIDWSWTALEIVRFCEAFDDPFDGASSFLDGKRVRLKKVQIDDDEIQFHPFQYGLIYRLKGNSVWIAAKNSGLRVSQFLCPSGLRIRLGKRLITSGETLLKAKLNLE